MSSGSSAFLLCRFARLPLHFTSMITCTACALFSALIRRDNWVGLRMEDC